MKRVNRLHRMTRLAAVVTGSALVFGMIAGCSEMASPDESHGVDNLDIVREAALPGILPYWIQGFAKEQGLFRDNGISFQTLLVQSGAALAAAMSSGQVDVAIAPPQVGSPIIAAGTKARYIMDTYALDVTVIAQPTIELPHLEEGFPAVMEDLRGLTVGVPARGTAYEQIMVEGLDQAGMKPDDVTFIAVGAGPSAVAAFTNKQVDVLLATPPYQENIGEGEYTDVLDTRDFLGANILYDAWLATDSFIGNEDLAKRFCTTIQTAHEMVVNPDYHDVVVSSVAIQLAITTDQAENVVEEYIDRFTTETITEERWDALSGLVADLTDFEDSVSPVCL